MAGYAFCFLCIFWYQPANPISNPVGDGTADVWQSFRNIVIPSSRELIIKSSAINVISGISAMRYYQISARKCHLSDQNMSANRRGFGVVKKAVCRNYDVIRPFDCGLYRVSRVIPASYSPRTRTNSRSLPPGACARNIISAPIRGETKDVRANQCGSI